MSETYDGVGASSSWSDCRLTTPGSNKTCTIKIKLTSAMKGPVYVYYGLDNFYQNHRRYVKSKADTQLAGTFTTDLSTLSSCDPLITNPANGKILHPCGLIAQSFFNGAPRFTGGLAISAPSFRLSSLRPPLPRSFPPQTRSRYKALNTKCLRRASAGSQTGRRSSFP